MGEWMLRWLACGALMCAAGAAQAGRPLSTDDAATIPPGECQMESWYQSADDAREAHLAPGCGVGETVEVGLEAIRFSPATGDRYALGAQLKSVFPGLATAGWQFGAKANAAAARTAAGARWESDTYGATAIATRELTDGLALHLNLGGERRKRDGRDATLYAVALAWSPSPQVLLFGEVLGDDRSSATRTVGARWWLLSERVGLDLTVGDQAGVSDSRFVTVGLSFYGWGR